MAVGLGGVRPAVPGTEAKTVGPGQIVIPAGDTEAPGIPRPRTLGPGSRAGFGGPARAAIRFPGPAAEHTHEPTVRPLLFVDEGARQRLEKRLQANFSEHVVLHVTDNKRTMISSARRGGILRVRLHHMFLDADAFTIGAVAKYLGHDDPHASRVVNRYIEAHAGRIRPNLRRTMRLVASGHVHDLEAIFRDLNRHYFGGAVDAAITWGRALGAERPRRSSIKLGSYSQAEKLIRVHRALDQAFVPRFMVEWIVYHEMLHHVLPMPLVNGRRVHHTAEFRARELSARDKFEERGRAGAC